MNWSGDKTPGKLIFKLIWENKNSQGNLGKKNKQQKESGKTKISNKPQEKKFMILEWGKPFKIYS